MTAPTTAVLVAGGGTAGHTNPGIATADALVDLGLPAEQVHFVGGERGSEGTLVPAAGYSIDVVPGRGIQRRLSASNLRSVLDLGRGLAAANSIVRRRRPSVVLCLGGYAAFGPSAAALAARIPVVVSEQNAKASLVNRLVGRFAATCALPFPGTDLPRGTVTGNPIRPEIVDAVRHGAREAARERLGLPADRVVVAVWSGSLGARTVNDAVGDLAEAWADRDDVVIHHVVGRRDWDSHGTPRSVVHRTVEYEDRMADLLVAADVAVCRAGASTVAELTVAGVPAVLVPLPGAPRDHQTANTVELVERGGAVRIDDADLDGETLATVLEPWLVDAGLRAEMAAAARSVARPEAAAAVARMLIAAGSIDVPTEVTGRG